MVLLQASSVLAAPAFLADLEREAKAHPKSAEHQLALGRGLRRAGKAERARGVLQQAARLADSTAEGGRILMEAARVRIDARDVAGALKACGAISKADAIGRGLFHACRAEAYLVQNRAAEALKEVDASLGQVGDLYEAISAQARCYSLQGKPEEAAAAFQRALGIARADDGTTHYHHALFLRNQLKREEAVQSLHAAVLRDPHNPWILRELAIMLGRTKEAEALVIRAVDIRDSFADAHALLATIAADLGDLDVAEKAARRAIQLDASGYDAWVALGRASLQRGKADDALSSGQRARKLIPNSAPAELLIADAYALKGALDEALAGYEKAFGMDRSTPAALLRGALAASKAGRATTARAFATKATSEFPTLRSGWVMLGDLLLAERDLKEARRAYEQALSGTGSEFSEAEIRERLGRVR